MMLFISPELLHLDDDLYARFAAVIDTRGLDGPDDREDLKVYIKETNNALCIFTDEFVSAPKNSVAFLKRYLTPEATDTASRAMLMILTERGQPENVVGAEGPVGEREAGIAIRRSQIESKLASERINLAPAHVIFYDALQSYIKDGNDHRRDPNYEDEEIEEQRADIFEHFNQIITTRNENLWREVNTIAQRFQQIHTGHSLSDADEGLIRAVKDDLKLYRVLMGMLPADTLNFTKTYLNSWMPKHAGTLRAINRRYGIYDDKNIYISAGSTAEMLARKHTEQLKQAIQQLISRPMEEAEAKDDLQPLVESFLKQVDTDYESFLTAVAQRLQEHMTNTVFAPRSHQNEFWRQVSDRFGKGKGYKNDVIVMYEDHLADKQVPEYFQKHMAQQWESFVDRIINFFG